MDEIFLPTLGTRRANDELMELKVEELEEFVRSVEPGAMTLAHGLEALEMALTAAKETGLPVMVHISKGARTPEILRKLRPGDIVPHCFQGRGDGILIEQQEYLLPEVIEARKRGVFFDVGHGCGSFSWETARKAFELSFFPDTISTDLHRFLISRWAIDMPTTMSKFLHIGMSLEEVILKSTWAPAKAINRDNDLGTLRKGTVADLLVFEIEEGEFRFEGTHFHTERATQKLKPFLVVRKGEITGPGSYPVLLRELYECDHEVLCLFEETDSQGTLPGTRPITSG